MPNGGTSREALTTSACAQSAAHGIRHAARAPEAPHRGDVHADVPAFFFPRRDAPVTDELQRLWRLHELDEEAARVKAALDQHPAERSAAETHLAAERAALERNRAAALEAQKRRRDLERQAEALTAEEKKFQGQLPQIKKNEEYQALLHEIEAVKGRRSDLETRVLEQLEIEEALDAERPALEAALGRAEAEVRERVAKIEAAEAAGSRQLAALEARREAQIGGLPPQTRARYERVHASRQGRAVVAIDKNACGGCYRALPPQIMQEAKKRDRLLTCEGCGRMVVYPPDAP
jgi:predicted  nucleic acid-binding Zn-ribbon protein